MDFTFVIVVISSPSWSDTLYGEVNRVVLYRITFPNI